MQVLFKDSNAAVIGLAAGDIFLPFMYNFNPKPV
jgi:hypothetical protein